jgi:alpha-galactosidase
MAGNDLRIMNKETAGILTNKEVIAINQDSLGIQALKYSMKDSVQTWVKPLKNGDWAIGFLNRSVSPKTIDINWNELQVTDTVAKRTFDTRNGNYKLRDLWLKKEKGSTKDHLKALVPAHDILLLRLRK